MLLLVVLFLLPFAGWMLGILIFQLFWPVLLVIFIIWVVVRVVSSGKGK